MCLTTAWIFMVTFAQSTLCPRHGCGQVLQSARLLSERLAPAGADAEARARLAVRVDHGAQQLPGPAAAPVHAHHAEDLQQAQAAQRRRGEDVALSFGRHDRYGGDEDNGI